MVAQIDQISRLDVAQAETELIGFAVRKPAVWNQIQHVRPEWFREFKDQAAWRALSHCYKANGGLAELDVLDEWLAEHYADDKELILSRIAECADYYLHSEFLEYYLSVLEWSGFRRSVELFASHLREMCISGRPINDITSVLNSPPVFGKGALV